MYWLPARAGLWTVIMIMCHVSRFFSSIANFTLIFDMQSSNIQHIFVVFWKHSVVYATTTYYISCLTFYTLMVTMAQYVNLSSTRIRCVCNWQYLVNIILRILSLQQLSPTCILWKDRYIWMMYHITSWTWVTVTRTKLCFKLTNFYIHRISICFILNILFTVKKKYTVGPWRWFS